MSDTETSASTTNSRYPSNWRIAADYDPNAHLMNLKGRDYLNVQNRLLWFIRDQRDLTVRGLATTSYVIRTELIEQDRESGYAHFRTYVRDVLGNEATMYGSETAKDFADYAEKASTKSLGRALLALGYGTAFAPEMDEGERVVDTPVDRQPATTTRNPLNMWEKQPPVIAAPKPSAKPAQQQKDEPANAHAQQDLLRQFTEHGYASSKPAEQLMLAVLGHGVSINKLKAGTSSITMQEVGMVLKKLGAEDSAVEEVAP